MSENTKKIITVSANTVATTMTAEEVLALNLEKEPYKAYKVDGWKKSKANGLKTMPSISIRLVRAKDTDVVVVKGNKYVSKPCLSVVRVSSMGCTFDVSQNKANPEKLFFVVSRDFDKEFEQSAAEVKKAPLKACERFIRERLTKESLQTFDELLSLALSANGLKVGKNGLVLA